MVPKIWVFSPAMIWQMEWMIIMSVLESLAKVHVLLKNILLLISLVWKNEHMPSHPAFFKVIFLLQVGM